MANLNGFDASSIDPMAPLSPIPAGNYLVKIVDSTMKTNRSETGKYLELKFQIIDGEYSGRFLWSRLNLDNPNATAVQIAKSELSAICRAVNVLKPRDSVDLHNLPLTVVVACKKRTDTGDITNEIKGYLPRVSQAAAPATEETAPWA